MNELTASQGAARALRCICGHPEHQHTWNGGGLSSTGRCWHKDRDFEKVPDLRDPMIPFIRCECSQYSPDREDEGGGLEARIAERFHPYMRDGDPHEWPKALEEARVVMKLVVDHFFQSDMS